MEKCIFLRASAASDREIAYYEEKLTVRRVEEKFEGLGFQMEADKNKDRYTERLVLPLLLGS